MTVRTLGALLLALLAPLGLVACERVEFRTDNALRDGEPATKAGTIDLTLLQKVADAPTTVAWSGRRRYEAHFPSGGAPSDMIYEETVTTDGHGQFELRADDLVEPSLPSGAESLFLLSQQNRESLMFRHRDPAIRGTSSFLANYTVVDSGSVESLLGRNCARWTVQSAHGGSIWTLWIDLATGVILKLDEHSEAQVLLARLEYLDFDDSPDTTNAVWHTSALDESPLDLGHAKVQLGFDPLMPKHLPVTFRLTNSERVVDPIDNRVWARFTYTDGWTEAIVMDGGPMASPQAAQGGVAPDADVMRFTTVGPWTIADGRVASRRLLAATRGSATLLKALIESSL